MAAAIETNETNNTSHGDTKMQVFHFVIEDQNGNGCSMRREASSWMTAWEVLGRRLRNAQIGKIEPMAIEWYTKAITVYDAKFQVVAKGIKSDLDKKLCYDATGKTEIKFGVASWPSN